MNKLETVSDAVAVLQQHASTALVSKHQSYPLTFNIITSEDGKVSFASDEKANEFDEANGTCYMSVEAGVYEISHVVFERIIGSPTVKDLIVSFRAERMDSLMGNV